MFLQLNCYTFKLRNLCFWIVKLVFSFAFAKMNLLRLKKCCPLIYTFDLCTLMEKNHVHWALFRTSLLYCQSCTYTINTFSDTGIVTSGILSFSVQQSVRIMTDELLNPVFKKSVILACAELGSVPRPFWILFRSRCLIYTNVCRYLLMDQHLLNIPIIFLCRFKIIVKIQACQTENKTSSTDNAVPIYCWCGETVHHMHTQTHSHSLNADGARFNCSLLSQHRNIRTQSPQRADDQHVRTTNQQFITGQKTAAVSCPLFVAALTFVF